MSSRQPLYRASHLEVTNTNIFVLFDEDNPFCTYESISRKPTISYTPAPFIHTFTCAHQGVHVSSYEKFAHVLNEWPHENPVTTLRILWANFTNTQKVKIKRMEMFHNDRKEMFHNDRTKIKSTFRPYLILQSECGKIQTRKTPNTDTFHAMWLTTFSCYSRKKALLKILDWVLNTPGQHTNQSWTSLVETLKKLLQDCCKQASKKPWITISFFTNK